MLTPLRRVKPTYQPHAPRVCLDPYIKTDCENHKSQSAFFANIQDGLAASPTQPTRIGHGRDEENGRGRGARTPDLRFWRPPLYQLSYTPTAL